MAVICIHHMPSLIAVDHTPGDGETQHKDTRYALGYIEPRYPMPSPIAFACIGRNLVGIWPADERTDRPVAEFWAERFKIKPIR